RHCRGWRGARRPDRGERSSFMRERPLAAPDDAISFPTVRRRMMARAFLVGRVLVGGYYQMGAFNHFTNTRQLASYAALHGVPAPTLAVVLAGVLLLIGGLSFLLGLSPRLGVAAMVVFFVPVTLIMHAFWADRDPMMRVNDFVNFGKNIAL